MSVYSLYFSPTGGVKKVLDILSESISIDFPIDLSEINADYSIYNLKNEDICFIALPVFGGRIPPVAIERLRQVKAGGALAFVVAVYGNRAYEDALLEMKNEAEACGFVVGAAIAANAEHSIIRKFGTGRPDVQDTADLRKYAATLTQIIAQRDGVGEISVPGNMPYKESAGVPMYPKADKSCVKCGICAKKCPVGAIPRESPNLLDKDKCISCMRCISVCPQNSRKLNKALLFVAAQSMKKAFSTRKSNELYTNFNAVN